MDFSHNRVLQMINDAQSRVKSARPEGAMQWLLDNRMDIVRHLEAAGQAVEAAFSAEDEPALFKALSDWENYHMKAWRIFSERPPVIERQEALFQTEGAASAL
jgi:hypothetical protein